MRGKRDKTKATVFSSIDHLLAGAFGENGVKKRTLIGIILKETVYNVCF